MVGARSRVIRFSIVAVTMLASSGMLLASATHSRGAVATGQTSSKVAVIPGFHPATYPGYLGLPPLPVGATQLAAYRFAPLSAAQVTPGALAPYDTVILYGTRWSDLSATARAAINTFAQTGKVIIWDADDTGAQNYSTFIHPFATAASGETHHKSNSVVSFPRGSDFLASDNSSSPYYLDPVTLISDTEMLNDMSVMGSGAANWAPALWAANASTPNGGWALAWTYGDIADQTGMTIYSGIDADAFAENSTPNYAIKELALQLAAPFTRIPSSSCAPNCSPPPPPPPPSKGSGSGGSGSSGGGGSGTYASCSLGQKAPTYWVRLRVPILLKTSVAAEVSGQVIAAPHEFLRHHQVVAFGRERTAGQLPLRINTAWLRSNHVAHLRALVYVNGQNACSLGFRLKVDNTPPRLLLLTTTAGARGDVVRFRVNEKSWVQIAGSGAKRRRWIAVAAGKTIRAILAGGPRHARLILRDRADNRLIRNLSWR
jgi:hypothetical protein